MEMRVVNLNALPPSEMARLLGKPEGEAGRAVGERLNRVNADITAAVYQRLLLRQGDHLLEVGFGNGRLLPALLAQAHDLTYVGIDIAETMVTEAVAFNAELVAAGIASFRLASVEAIPCPDQGFDRVFAVNVIYFWPDPVRALSEMRRVLRPGGMSVVAALKPDPDQPPPFAREEYGFRVRDGATLAALHRDAGFGYIELGDYEEIVTRTDGTPWKRGYSIVIARP
jgi:ubiquinone/menaquinone biosynthesis C-methylase UbiE